MTETIHVVSATAVYDDDSKRTWSHLAMCGENLGRYEDAAQVHPVGNYTTATSQEAERVTCAACRSAMGWLDFGARYTARGYEGVALWLKGYAQRDYTQEPELDCRRTACDHSDSACWITYETEMVSDPRVVLAVMVGDDREHEIDVTDLTVIQEGDYCQGCGQIGCAHGGQG